MSSRPLLTPILALFGLAVALVLGAGYLATAAGPEAPPATGPASGEVELHDVKYDQLVKKVKELRGSIVVVDVWATWCVPCRREFPGLVQMHNQRARDGVVCLSVSVDEPDNRGEALDFLRGKKATLWNYYLAENASVWQKRWDTDSVPLVMVFDRTGQRAARFPVAKGKAFTYADVEKVVQALLTQPR